MAVKLLRGDSEKTLWLYHYYSDCTHAEVERFIVALPNGLLAQVRLKYFLSGEQGIFTGPCYAPVYKYSKDFANCFGQWRTRESALRALENYHNKNGSINRIEYIGEI